MADTLVIGIDSSTTACKAIAWDRSGRAVAEGRASYPLLGHIWIFDFYASGNNNDGRPSERHQRLTYTPYLGWEQTSLDWDGDGMIDRWEDRFDNDARLPVHWSGWPLQPDRRV